MNLDECIKQWDNSKRVADDLRQAFDAERQEMQQYIQELQRHVREIGYELLVERKRSQKLREAAQALYNEIMAGADIYSPELGDTIGDRYKLELEALRQALEGEDDA